MEYLTLNQYYDREVKKLGFKSWNAFCANHRQAYIDYAKKQMKKEYKELKSQFKPPEEK